MTFSVNQLLLRLCDRRDLPGTASLGIDMLYSCHFVAHGYLIGVDCSRLTTRATLLCCTEFANKRFAMMAIIAKNRNTPKQPNVCAMYHGFKLLLSIRFNKASWTT